MPNILDPVKEQRQQLVDKVVADLQEGKVFMWDSGHYGKSTLPRNIMTGKPYKGINNLQLMIEGEKQGYKDPRWATFKQIAALGGSLKGQHGTHIEFWEYEKIVYETDPKTGKYVIDPKTHKKKPVMEKNPDTGKWEPKKIKREQPLVKSYVVFNFEQISDLPEDVKEKLALPEPKITIDENDRNPYMENMIKNSEAQIIYDQQNRNFYRQSTDEIHVMDREMFKTMNNFYATVAHEIAHSTGHENRLNRFTLTKSDGFGGKTYAKEELRAEMTSMFLQQEYGIKLSEEHFQNHEAYLQSWIKVLQEDPNELFRAANDAGYAADYVKKHMIEKGLELPKEQAKAKDLEATPEIEKPKEPERQPETKENERPAKSAGLAEDEGIAASALPEDAPQKSASKTASKTAAKSVEKEVKPKAKTATRKRKLSITAEKDKSKGKSDGRSM